MRSTKRDLARFRVNEFGRLRSYIEQGGQKKPVVYHCKDGKVICARCADDIEFLVISKDSSFEGDLPVLDGGGIYQQGPPIPCGMCEKELRSVRGE